MGKFKLKSSLALLSAGLFLASASWSASESRISDVPITPNYEGYERTKPLLEWGEPFLSTGNIDPGFELPTGAVWQPQFLVWGDLRTALQDFDSGGTHSREWASRLNLFAQLRLAPTERILVSFRPLDIDGRYAGKQWEPEEKSVNGFNTELRTLYFEGDFGEIFPNLDPKDFNAHDWGFAVGRQPVFIQEGLLINDIIDAVGVVRNSIRLPGFSNTRVTGMFGWDQIHRDNNQEDSSADMWGVFVESDLPLSTVNLDLVYVNADDATGDGYYAAVSAVQRLGHLNTSFRALYSAAQGNDNAAVSTGTLLFAETSWSPTGTHDNVYINGYLGIDQFSSVARDVEAGGPLGRTGILFASVGLGNYGAALNNRPDDSYGGAIGYQRFITGQREQLIVELGARNETKGPETGAVAIGARYQRAFGRHTILVVDGFLNDSDASGQGSGIRTELRWKF